MLRRAGCPPAVFLDNRRAKESLAALFQRLAVPVEPEVFLTRCVKCNGAIKAEGSGQWPAGWDGARARAADGVPQDLPLFLCTNEACLQVYWFSNRPNSSAVRSKELADELHEIVKSATATAATTAAATAFLDHSGEGGGGGGGGGEEAAKSFEEQGILALSTAAATLTATGVLAGGTGGDGGSDNIDVVSDDEEEDDDRHPTSPMATAAATALPIASRRERAGAMKAAAATASGGSSSRLRHSLQLRSAYHHGDDAQSDEGGGLLTTSRGDFHGYLDYVFYGSRSFRGCARRLELPTAEELQRGGVFGQLPSRSWGSDHLLVAADLLWAFAS